MSTPTHKVCPRCGKISGLLAAACDGCGRQYKTQFEQTVFLDPNQNPVFAGSLPATAPRALQNVPPEYLPPTSPLPYPMAGGYPQAGGQYVPPGAQVVNVQVNQKSDRSGWLAALLLVLFGTPFGWVIFAVLGIGLWLLFIVGSYFLPLILSMAAATGIGLSRMERADKTPWIVACLLAGAISTGLWWGYLANVNRAQQEQTQGQETLDRQNGNYAPSPYNRSTF